MFGRRFGVVAPGPSRWRFTAVAALAVGVLAGGGPWAAARDQLWSVPGGGGITVFEPVLRMHQGSPSLLAATDGGRRLVRWSLDREGRPHLEAIAGTGGTGDAPDGTPAEQTALEATAIARNASGEIFFLESWKHRVRKIGLL